MTEQEWLACKQSQTMVEFVRGKTSDRQLRLFACACCRQKWGLLNESLRTAVEVAESYAGGSVTQDALSQAHESAWGNAPSRSLHRVCWVTSGSPRMMLEAANVVQSHLRCGLLRHIVGNPFRPYTVSHPWSTAVVQLATALNDGDDSALPLHDALLESGHPELAEHFRQEQHHPKGCWAVDVILGKS